jgi:hypothetical protein
VIEHCERSENIIARMNVLGIARAPGDDVDVPGHDDRTNVVVGGDRDLLLSVQLQKMRPGVRKLVWQVSVPIVGGAVDIFHANHGLNPADHVHEGAPHAAKHNAVSVLRGSMKRGLSSRRSPAEKRH